MRKVRSTRDVDPQVAQLPIRRVPGDPSPDDALSSTQGHPAARIDHAGKQDRDIALVTWTDRRVPDM